MQEHLPYVLPIVFSTTMNNMNWSIGLEVTLSVLGFTDINTPTIGGMIYWANQHTAHGRRRLVVDRLSRSLVVVMAFIGLFLLAVSMNEYIDPRSRLSRMGGAPDDAPSAPSAAPRGAGPAAPVLSVDDLRAYYQHALFRRRPARCGRSTTSASRSERNEIYGLAGESSSRQDHADQDHRRRDPAAARGRRRLGDVQLPGRRAGHAPRQPARRWPASAGGISPTSCRAR